MPIIDEFLADVDAGLKKFSTAQDGEYGVFARSLEERALDGLMLALWECTEHKSVVAMLTACAEHVLPIARKHSDPAEAKDAGLFEDNGLGDAVVPEQIAAVTRWLASPSDSTEQGIVEQIDPSRQLQYFCDDFYPLGDMAWLMLIEVGDLLARTITQVDQKNTAQDAAPDEWPAALTARGCLVCCLPVLALEGGESQKHVATLLSVMQESLMSASR